MVHNHSVPSVHMPLQRRSAILAWHRLAYMLYCAEDLADIIIIIILTITTITITIIVMIIIIIIINKYNYNTYPSTSAMYLMHQDRSLTLCHERATT